MKPPAELYHRLKQIDVEIRDAGKRLPAHSIKPVLMQTLFKLEDERDSILKQLKALPANEGNPLGLMVGRM
jgi:hypothetical protein